MFCFNRIALEELEVSFSESLRSAFLEAGPRWAKDYTKLLAFGPRRIGSNVLINSIPGSDISMWRSDEGSKDSLLGQNLTSVMSGFEMGVSTGPLCGKRYLHTKRYLQSSCC